ncbi:hypothetical protein [Anaerovibrio lipolyticus]|uniref:hypothetical protein n=1 Tax=Anaerovibrio lipolyticus TaxID=82374 RepID=UPI0026ED0454|nr:hypothetical protein [Anaerovibrio lipolyticus]MBE6104988.1 hypothetical protein [Anaerovibrio lipolyticus]
MKKYESPSIVTYFEAMPIMPLAAVGAAVSGAVSSVASTSAIGKGVAAGITAGMLAGRRDIYHGRRSSMIPCIE